MSYQDSPGNIRNQVGRCLNLIGVNIEQQDVPGVMNFTRFLVALAAPVLAKDETRNNDVQGLLAVSNEGDMATVFERQMKITEIVLLCLTDANLYAYGGIGDLEDASELANGL